MKRVSILIGRVPAIAAALLVMALVPTSPQAQGVGSPKPKLVVVVSIDQFSADLFAKWRGRLPGGLGFLSQNGIVYPNGFQSHGMTETCPGHSTILTGKHPNKTGISANDWFDKQSGQIKYCLDDPDVTLAHNSTSAGVSPKLLVASTYGDWLKASSPASRVFGVSGKDRGAITMSGHRANGVFWWAPGFGFTTWLEPGQTAQEKLAPVAALNSKLLADNRARPFTWRYADQRCKALEGDYSTGGRAWRARLPLAPPSDTAAAEKDALYSPYLDDVTFQAAEALLDEFKLGDGEATDLLTLSLSATDLVGHRFGAQGPEMCDQIARLDARLGRFLQTLQAVHGQVLVVLTADHGGSDFPERLSAQGQEGERLPASDWLKKINQNLREQFDLTYDPLLQAGGLNSLYVVGPAKTKPSEEQRRKLIDAALNIMRDDPKVYEAYASEDLIGQAQGDTTSPPNEITVRERMRRSAFPGRVGDIVIAFKPYVTAYDATASAVAGHGTPWNYDRRVPIIFWWKGGEAQERVLPLETVDIAPTLAAVTDVTPPSDIDGRCRRLTTTMDCPN